MLLLLGTDRFVLIQAALEHRFATTSLGFALLAPALLHHRRLLLVLFGAVFSVVVMRVD